jgi:hypothetical protein
MTKSKSTLKKEAEMFNGSLPIVNAKVKIGYDKNTEEYIFGEIPVEVLTVNFNTYGMRVRYMAAIHTEEKTIQTANISLEFFIKQYSLKEVR